MKISNFLVFSLSAGLVWGVPTANGPEELPLQRKGENRKSKGAKTFSLSEIHNVHFKARDVSAESVRVHLKYNLTSPLHLRATYKSSIGINKKFRSLKNPRDGFAVTVPTPIFDSEYILPVEIGTPPQTIPLVLDTGSSELWTFSTDTYLSWLSKHILYKPHASTTSHKLEGYFWKVKYGDDSDAHGIVYEDTVRIGGTAVERQAVQSAVGVSKPLLDNIFTSGILGMAAHGANSVWPIKQNTYLSNVKDQLSQPLFTADLQKGRPGTYDFGFINRLKYYGQLKFEDIDQNSPYWMITASGYQVGKEGSFSERHWNAIVDTGTTLLMLPDDMVYAYYKNVKSAFLDLDQRVVMFSCDEKLPDFVFGLGQDYRGVVPGHYMNYYTTDGQSCYGGIQPLNGAPFAVIGDILLKAQFVVFDIGNYRVGFANKPTVSP